MVHRDSRLVYRIALSQYRGDSIVSVVSVVSTVTVSCGRLVWLAQGQCGVGG